MAMDIRNVRNITDLVSYFSQNLDWDIDIDDFDTIEDVSYDFSAADIGLKEESFAKISSLRQLQPLVDGQKWGIFCVEFDSNKFEISALRKILSGLVPRRRNSVDHAVWIQQDLLFICNWGTDNNRTIGIAHFEDQESGLPQIKMISCAPALEDFTQIKVFEDRLANLKWPRNTSNIEEWRTTWSSAFTTGYRQIIQDSSTLTVQLAAEAQEIRNRILDILKVETKNGYVHLLYDKFKDTLVHDMKETDFADMYAQTLVYGLFSARCMDETQDDFSAAEAIECLPNTNPFLKNLMRDCLSANNNSILSFDELEISNIVDLLKNTNTSSIIQDFNRQTGGGKEDPVIHFYEEFLTAYDKAQKVQRGVYYTPQPVVNFMVRAVDYILKNEFGYEDGLATTETKTIKIKRQSKTKRDGLYHMIDDTEEVPAVQVLDPATGTGTFIRQIILQIYDNFKEKNKKLNSTELKKAWNEYVPKHLLPRLNAFELMMAPYAVAHMKLAMVLKDTGYDFMSPGRLNVFLTNTLEEPGNSEMQQSLFEDPLATESIAANIVKKNTGINVVIGNPPYAGESSNKGKYILDLLDGYKLEPHSKNRLNERNPKWINDDYVKFIRFAQNFESNADNCVLAYICPHGFLDNPTFRGMRWNLMQSFNKMYILDLHGNVKKQETSPGGSKDENVFDIQQGVNIVLFVRNNISNYKGCRIYHSDLYGTRYYKYDYLYNASLNGITWSEVTPKDPFFLFKPIKEIDDSIEKFNVIDAFIMSTMGFQTHRDNFAVAFTREEIEQRIHDLTHSTDKSTLIAKYNLVENDSWTIEKARNKILSLSESQRKERITKCQYRLFDERWCFLDDSIMDRPRINVFSNVSNKDNIVLGVGRQGLAVGNIEWCLATISKYAIDANIFRRGGITAFPLYVYEDNLITNKRTVNFNPSIVMKLTDYLGVNILEANDAGVSPETFIDYILAILYSHTFRKKYSDELKIDYPKIPFPSSLSYFKKMAMYGCTVRKTLELDRDDLDKNYCFSDGSDLIEKYKLTDNKIYINKDQYLYAISQNTEIKSAWDYTIGGNQPLQKWLKDRKGKYLSQQGKQHFIKMINAVDSIIRIMNEIDKVIEL